jgi:hypothetical protein
MKDSHLPWYCETSRDHLHASSWEADNCTELYELWQEAMGHLMDYVRADEVEQAVNLALLERGSPDLGEHDG